MDYLKHYYVSDNFDQVSPYYEPQFKDRSDLQRVTVPQDDVVGTLYLIK